MFNWFRSKKRKANGKQLNKDTSDSGAFIPIMVSSDLDEKDKNHSNDHFGHSESASSDYSNGTHYDSGGSGGGGGFD